jgi:hypothetical protein
MNWLIVYTGKNSSKNDELKQFFKKNKIKAKSFLYEKDTELSVNTLPSMLKGVSHCVILDGKAPAKNASFAWGYLLGAGVLVYALKDDFTASAKKCGQLKDFDSFEKLFGYISKNIASIALEDKKKAAWAKLFDTGNPFTGDALSVHVKKDNRDVVQTYLDAGMSLNERDAEGTPMLNVAIRAEQIEEVKWMLEHDIDLNAVSKDRGYSALMDCVWKKNLELAKILVAKKANLDFVSADNQSALALAVGEGNADMVKLLSDAGANPDKFDALGMSPWTYAKLFKRQDLLSLMEKNHHGQ